MTICQSCGINTAVYGVCSHNPEECGQAHGRVMEAKPWAFPCDESPHVEVMHDAWYFIFFVLLVAVLWAAVSLVSNLIN